MKRRMPAKDEQMVEGDWKKELELASIFVSRKEKSILDLHQRTVRAKMDLSHVGNAFGSH